MAIKKFKIEASEQAKQLAKKPVKASDGEWDKAVVSFIDSIPTLPEQGKVISKKYKGFPVVIVGLGDGKCLYNGYTRTNDAASDVQFIRSLIKRGDSPEKATVNMGFKTYTRDEVEGACGGKKKSVKSATDKKRWGLYSDFGQRILNETFDSKREAQKAFREYGYTKDSEAWIEEVDETAVGKFDKKPANSACGGKKSVKSSAKRSVKCAETNADLERAKQNIVDGYNNENDKDYTVDEYFADEDLNRVPILYTTIGDTDDHEYQLYADLINPKIIVEIDGETVYEDKFLSIGALADDLEDFDWDNWYSYYLRYVPDEIVFGEEVNGACGGKKSVNAGRDKLKARKDWAVDVASRYSLFNGKTGDIENSNNKAELIRKCRRMSDPAWVEDNMLSGIVYNNDAQTDVDNADNPNYKPKKKSVKSSKRSRSVKAASADGYKFAFYRDGYKVLHKTENNRGKWLAQKDDEEPFEITYEQARGFEPIDPRNRALQMKLGKALKLPIRSSAVKAAKKDDMNKEAHKWYNISLTKDEYAKFRKFLKENGYKYEPSEEGQNTYVKVYLTKADADKVNKFLDSMDDVESACGGKKSKKTVKASAAAKRRAKQKVTASMPDLEDIVMYFDHKKIYEGDGSGLTAAVEELCKDDEIKAKFVEWCNQFGDPIAFESGDAHDTAFAFAWLVDTIRYEELDKFYIDGDGILNFEIFNKSDEVTGAKEPVTCSEDGPLCVCDSCLAGIESHEGRQVIYDEIYSDADYGEPPLICDWCGDEVEKLYQITPGERIESAERPVKASKYYEITDHYNDEVGRADTEDEARELAKKLVRENDVDHYDIFWVDTDPDSTDDTSYIDTVYADKPFSVEGYYETNFRGLSDSDAFYELRDALEYAQELLSKGLSVRLECENAGGRVEITPDEYDEFMATNPEYFEDLPKLAEWISDVQVERMDSRQEPWLDNWQYNTDIGMSVKCSIDSEYNTEILAEVDDYIVNNYPLWVTTDWVTYNGPDDWSVAVFADDRMVLDDFIYFFNENNTYVSDRLKTAGILTDALSGNDFKFELYPYQGQWTAPQIDVDEEVLEEYGDTGELYNEILAQRANFEAMYINALQDVNEHIGEFLKSYDSGSDVETSIDINAAIEKGNKTDYASNPIYELDKYIKDLAEGVAAAAGITLTYQVSDEAITFIDGDGTAVFIQPISEITPEPDDLENDIQQLVSAIQSEDWYNQDWETEEDDPDYATRAVQMSVDDELEPVMGEGEDIGFGIDSNGETIDESTVSELYRIAEKEILPNTELAQLDPYVSIDEDSWDFYFGGISNNGMMGVVKFYFHFKLTSDNIDLNEYVLPDAKLYPDFNYYKASLDFDIYTENGKVTDVVLESADIYKSDNSYDSHFSGKFGEAFNTEALENYIEKLAAPAAEEIYNAVSNL